MPISQTSIKALNTLVHHPITEDMIQKIIVATLQVLPCQEQKKYPSPPSSPSDKNSEQPQLPSLGVFLKKLIKYTNVYTGTLLATLVYLNRLKNKLPKNAQGLPCTRHRILLSCLILSAKNHNDSSPKNIHWAKYTDGLFSVKDINLMERQLLFLLNWDLRVTNEEMYFHYQKMLDPIKQNIRDSEKLRRYLKEQEKQRIMSKEMNNLSRSSSACSNLSMHYRSESSSSTSSISSLVENSPAPNMKKSNQHLLSNHNVNYRLQEVVDPRIEMAAVNETRKLNQMLESFSKVPYTRGMAT